MKPGERVLLFAHPRSGSSNLYRILQLHPALEILEEPFNEDFVNWQPENKDYLGWIRDVESLDEQLAEIFTRFNGVKVLRPELTKLNSAATYRFLPNAQAVNDLCGSDSHGWLFEGATSGAAV